VAGNFQEALEHYQQSLSQRESILGTDHSHCDQLRAAVAACMVHLQIHASEEARCFHGHPLKPTPPERHQASWCEFCSTPKSSAFFCDACDFDVCKGCLFECQSLDFYEKALSIYESTLGDGHPRCAEVRFKMSKCAAQQLNMERAMIDAAKALTIHQEASRKDGPDTSDMLTKELQDYLDKLIRMEEALQGVSGEGLVTPAKLSDTISDLTTMTGKSSAANNIDPVESPKMKTACDTIIPNDALAPSVHYLATQFLDEVLSTPGLSRESTFYEIEDLSVATPPGVIRRKGPAAYVDNLKGNDNVGPATHMLSWTWA